MIYRVLKFLFYFAIRGYFRSISIRNPERVPKTGPVIFVANHTSAFMDPMVIGLFVNRALFFLTRGEAFKNTFSRFILTRLNMIPIYRPEITPDEMFRNEEIFQKCYDHLTQGKCILIFPEGFSKTERQLRKLKTGAARIALGAEAQNDFKLGLTILPVGINYSNPHFFHSDLLINFGTPIRVSSYQENYKENAFHAAHALMDVTKRELEKQTIVIQHEELDKLIGNIEKIYRAHLRELSRQDVGKSVQNFYASKEIVNAVTYFYQKDKEKVLQVNELINNYLDDMKKIKLRDTQLRTSTRKQNLLFFTLFMALAFPVFVFGYINNYLPFKSAQIISGKMAVREDFRGSIQLSIGLLSFLVFYIFQTMVVLAIFSGLIAILYLLVLYPSGLFTLKYLKNYFKFRTQINLFRLFMTQGDVVARLAMLRQDIIDELEKGKEEYLHVMELSVPQQT